jgi:cysteine desulfurase/selenocysteine lyase
MSIRRMESIRRMVFARRQLPRIDRGTHVDIGSIRKDFPILQRQIGGRMLVYLDNAATTQKPRQVLDTIQAFYTTHNGNIHRSPHTLGQEATDLYEQAHRNVARFIGAEDWREIVFVRNSTEGLNLVAYSLLHGKDERLRFDPGDEIVLTVAEHHSNLVPWQMVRERRNVTLKYVGVSRDGSLDLAQLQASLTDRTKLVCCTHVSNVLGAINPVAEIGRLAHRAGALFLVDGAQSVPHLPVSVREIGCDFLVFSGHKMLAPMGIGALYGRRELLEEMTPFMHGGDMIDDVTLEGATWNELPWKFEAGTPNVCGGIALGGATDRSTGHRLQGAVDYLERLGMEFIRQHEIELTERVLQGLQAIPEVHIYGSLDARERCGVVAFNLNKNGEWIDSHLIAQLLDDVGFAVRAGGHCAYPLAHRLQVTGTVRVSLYLYNTAQEIDDLTEALRDIIKYKLL